MRYIIASNLFYSLSPSRYFLFLLSTDPSEHPDDRDERDEHSDDDDHPSPAVVSVSAPTTPKVNLGFMFSHVWFVFDILHDVLSIGSSNLQAMSFLCFSYSSIFYPILT